MADIVLTKTPAGALVPMDEQARSYIAKLKTGKSVKVTIRRARNLFFHRKGFALFKLAFDAWEPQKLQYRGEIVTKDFDRFRKDITIIAGFYTPVYNARGEVRLEAESLSFVSMDEERFDEVYRAVLNVVWARVLKNAGYESEAEVNRVIEELLRFE